MKKAKNKMLSGAIVLGLGTFIAKFLGAVYRFPLARIIGSTGLGLYQMVFPVYTVLLDFSGLGVPNALSKLISGFDENERENNARKYLSASIKTFCVLGLIGFILMSTLSIPFSTLQGNSKAYLAYIALSPSVILVSLICCYRGYFQGKMKMFPTAFSQIIEQTIKLVFGLVFSYLLAFDVVKATAGATFAITLSELFAVIFLVILYNKQKQTNGRVIFEKGEFKEIIKRVIKIAIPITLIGIIIPISQVADSFLALNIMSGYRKDATNLYGLFSGGVMPILSLPIAVCYGLATVSVPYVSGAKTLKDKEAKGKRTILLTFFAGLIFSVLVFIFSPIMVNILFSSLSGYERGIILNLLRLCSPCVLFLSLLQTQNSVLIGMNKPYRAVISLSVGVSSKIILSAILLSNTKINIYGLGLALIACYFSACLVNLIMLVNVGSKNGSAFNLARRVRD